MTTVISTINLKGGVGKTTLTVALAEFLAVEHNKHVLMIDLDPQTNATVALIEEKKWIQKDKNGKTLLRLFKDKVEKKNEFKIEDAIIKHVSNVSKGINNLDLLPSSLGLIEIQDQLAMVPSGNFFVTSPVTILQEAMSSVIGEYDFVLIDCPPNLGIITLNGINISNYFLIPVIPDILSTYGIPSILNRIKKFKEASKKDQPSALGIVISMYRPQSRLHDSIISNLRAKASNDAANLSNDVKYPRVFKTKIPLTVRAAEASDLSGTVNTLKQKYGYKRAYEEFSSITNELLTYV